MGLGRAGSLTSDRAASNVLFAVLQECEHQRRALLPNEAEARLAEVAREKLAAIRASYEERGGTAGYWSQLEREVLATALPQYVPAALEQMVRSLSQDFSNEHHVVSGLVRDLSRDTQVHQDDLRLQRR